MLRRGDTGCPHRPNILLRYRPHPAKNTAILYQVTAIPPALRTKSPFSEDCSRPRPGFGSVDLDRTPLQESRYRACWESCLVV